MSDRVRITEVAPRDGLQAEPTPLPTQRKAELVRACAATGVDEIELTSFVRPDWVPQLGDAAELCALLAPDKPRGILYSALVPNERGLDAALAVNAAHPGLLDKVSVFTAASETFAQRNTNASIDQTLSRFAPVVRRALDAGLLVRGYISCVIACPFEGAIDPEAVAAVALRLADLGIPEIDLGDTIGAGDAETVPAMLAEVESRLGDAGHDGLHVTLHLHDTFGKAAECVRAALDMGVRSFDASAAGLGGCPFASTPGRRAPGNIATHTLVRAIEEARFSHGVNHAALDRASTLAASILADMPTGPARNGASGADDASAQSNRGGATP